MIGPFLVSIGFAGGVIVDKIILSRRKLPLGSYKVWLFFLLFLLTAPLLVFWGRVEIERLLEPPVLGLFGAMTVVAVAWNILYYRSLAQEEVQEFELFLLASPLLSVLLAALFFPPEREPQVFLAALFAGLVLVAAHFRRHHLRFTRATPALLGTTFLLAFEPIFQKPLLEVFSPAALYFWRTFTIFLVFALWFKPPLGEVSKTRTGSFLVLTSLFGVMQMVARFQGFVLSGIAETMLFVMLGPILVYFFDALLLREKLKPQTLIAAATIALAIVWVKVLP